MPDDNDFMLEALKRNAPYVAPGEHEYDTNLGLSEPDFRYWLANNKVNWDPHAQNSDYDMRGYYKALASGDPKAVTEINPNDRQRHFPDYWKTPYHQTFSSESQWAGPTAPMWNEQDQLISPGGRIIRDERNPYPEFGHYLRSSGDQTGLEPDTLPMLLRSLRG
jgi:hypothetical protein